MQIKITYFTSEWGTQANGAANREYTSTCQHFIISQPIQAMASNKEGRILLAMQAIDKGQIRSVRAAASIYNIPPETLRRRIKGQPSRRDSTPNSRRLSSQEELAIIHYILDLDSRGFSPRPSEVRDMANLLLAERQESPVGVNWVSNFINRRSEIQTKFSRKYDYKRALCEDPQVIEGWFRLVQNVKVKYGILEEDIYNFDEAGFMMGVIATAKVVTSSEARNRPKRAQPGNREWVSIIQGINSTGWTIPPFIIFKAAVHLSAWYEDSVLPCNWVITLSENGWTTNEIGYEWIQHFNKYTKERTIGQYRLLILDGHESHISAQFQQYCKKHNIITLCMPPHSSHLLQPLDVGCFGPLKAAYNRQIENLMRLRINHITKLEFLPAFKEAFNIAFTKQNIKSGFRATGLVPYSPDNVLSHLDLKLKTPTPPPSRDQEWTPKTPQTLKELSHQTEHIRNRVRRHQNSSPSSINEALGQLAKGAEMMMHSAVLLKAEVKALREANEVKTRRERKQKRQIAQGGSLTIQEGEELSQRGQIEEERVHENKQPETIKAKKQSRCSICGNSEHTARICQQRII